MQIDNRISDCLSKVILYFSYLGYITSEWGIKENRNIPTIGTNYKELHYNPEFVNVLTNDELCGVIIHEVMHCLFLHPTEISKVEKSGKNIEMWTIAEEIVTNAAVKDFIKDFSASISLPGAPYSPLQGTKPPENTSIYFYDPIGHSHTVEEVYNKLIKSKKVSIPKTAILYDDVLPSNDKESTVSATETAIAVLTKMSTRRGDMPDALNRHLKKLISSKIPWQRILANFVAGIKAGMDTLRWEHPDWKRQSDILMPGTVSMDIENVIVAVDTSGSINEEQLLEFASGIAKLTVYVPEITIITTDAVVHEKIKIKSARELITKIKFEGGGGTNFEEIFSKVKKTKCLIFFTDGYATFPERKPPYPVLWVLTSQHSAPPFGKVAYLLEK